MPRRKGNQSGSYRINGSGKWVVRYGELRCDGKAIRTKYTDRTLRLATPKEIEDFRQSRKVPRTVERDGGALVAAANELRVAPSQLASFAKTAEAYRETMEGRLSRGTQRTYNTILDAHLLPLFGEYQLNELSPLIIERALMHRLALVSISTVHDMRKVLSVVLTWAQKKGFLPLDRKLPTELVDLPTREHRAGRRLTDAEVSALCAQMVPRDAHLFWFLWHTGCRIGEALGLRWDAVNLTAQATAGEFEIVDGMQRRVEIPAGCFAVIRQFTGHWWSKPKNSRGARIVPINAPLRAIFEAAAIAGTEPERCVFGNRAGGPRHTGNVAHDVLKPAARRAGLGVIRLHDFRHSWVSRAHDEGVSVETRAAIAGHSAAVDRATYTHVGDQREAMEKMAKKGMVN